MEPPRTPLLNASLPSVDITATPPSRRLGVGPACEAREEENGGELYEVHDAPNVEMEPRTPLLNVSPIVCGHRHHTTAPRRALSVSAACEAHDADMPPGLMSGARSTHWRGGEVKRAVGVCGCDDGAAASYDGRTWSFGVAGMKAIAAGSDNNGHARSASYHLPETRHHTSCGPYRLGKVRELGPAWATPLG
ncbi:hypothetical protein K438DRAFT_2013409 [Mycena galopus ATCC 62051]|nr:hypothetical protein K438DRAFT_2013409 [Mycena galopus ATCC 62051]